MFRAGPQAPDIGRALLTMLRTVAGLGDRAPRPWTGSWTEPTVQPVRSGPSAARLRGSRAASAHDARSRTSHNPPVVDSSPTRPTCDFTRSLGQAVDRIVDRCRWSGEPSCRDWYTERSHRATAERILARQGIRWNRPAHRLPGQQGYVSRQRFACLTWSRSPCASVAVHWSRWRWLLTWLLGHY